MGMVAAVGEATVPARGRVDQAGLCAHAGVGWGGVGWGGGGGGGDGSTLKDGAGVRRTASARRCWRA